MYSYTSRPTNGGPSVLGYNVCQSVPPMQKGSVYQQPYFISPSSSEESLKRETVTEPRSLSEINSDAMASKFRQLPCRTFVSVGTCPYRERCVYLHDPRVICREAKTKTRRKNKDDVAADSLFWPVMSSATVSQKLDSNRQPHVVQSYVVNPAQNDQFKRHDQAVYSMWMYFVDMCLACSASEAALSSPVKSQSQAAPCFQAPDLPINTYTSNPRLDVFRKLSSSQSLAADSPVRQSRAEAPVSPCFAAKSPTQSMSSRSVSPTTVVSVASYRGASR